MEQTCQIPWNKRDIWIQLLIILGTSFFAIYGLSLIHPAAAGGFTVQGAGVMHDIEKKMGDSGSGEGSDVIDDGSGTETGSMNGNFSGGDAFQ